MRHYPSNRQPVKIEGLSHASAPILNRRHWLMFGIGFWLGIMMACIFFVKCCQGGAL